MKVSVSTGLYYTKPYDEILDIIAEAGGQYIELFMNQAFLDVPLEAIKKAVDQRGLKVLSIHLPLTFLAHQRDESEDYWMAKCIEYAEVLGAKVLVSHFFYKKDGSGNNDQNHFETIEKYTKLSNKHICTENFPKEGLETILRDNQALVLRLEGFRGCMTYDTTHAASTGVDIVEQYHVFKPYIRNIHLSDFKDGNEHIVLGGGDLPIRKLVKALKTDDYPHPLTLEFDFENPKRNQVSDNKTAVRMLKDSIQYIHGCIK